MTMKTELKYWAPLLALCCICCAGTQTDSSQTRRLDLGASAKIGGLSDPNISPDGKSIVVVVARANYEENRWENELTLVDIATGAQRVLTTGRPEVSQPRWSPNGDRL